MTDLVFFRDAVAHVARLTRILLQPRGNALLVGVGGSGRKSLARLAAFMSGSIIKTIEVTSQYSMVEWREDIKINLMAAGKSKIQSEGAAREWSTVVDISMTPPSFKPVLIPSHS